MYGQMIFDKSAKIMQLGNVSFQQIVLGELDIHVQENEVGPLPNTRLNH